MKVRIFNLLFILLMLCLSVLVACNTGSESASGEKQIDYPEEPIKMVVSYAPGGITDTVARIVAEEASKHLPKDQEIVVENKPGAGGTLAVSDVISKKPDGYTIGITGLSPLSVLPHLGEANYTVEDMDVISRVISAPLVLVVKEDSPWETVEDWLEYVKENPGDFRYGTQGTGGASHLTMEAINQEAGVETRQIAFEGSAPALTAVLGGQIEGAVVQDNEAHPYTESGDMRVLFSTAESTVYPDLSTLNDAGIEYESEMWTGIFAPKGLPEGVRDILVNAIEKGLKAENTKETLEKQMIFGNFADPEEFQTVIESDYERYGKIMRDVGIID